MDGIKLISKERERQIAKGRTPEHDQQYHFGDLAVQAASILVDGTNAKVIDEVGRGTVCDENDGAGDSWDILKKWYEREPDDPKRYIRLLSIAGALVAAEIDRVTMGEEQEVTNKPEEGRSMEGRSMEYERRMEFAREEAAKAWGMPETSNKIMDPVLAEEFAKILVIHMYETHLGCSTTGELLDEVKARVDTSYSTIRG